MTEETELDSAGCLVHTGCNGLVFILTSGVHWCMGCNRTWNCDEDGGCDEGHEWKNSGNGR